MITKLDSDVAVGDGDVDIDEITDDAEDDGGGGVGSGGGGGGRRGGSGMQLLSCSSSFLLLLLLLSLLPLLPSVLVRLVMRAGSCVCAKGGALAVSGGTAVSR